MEHEPYSPDLAPKDICLPLRDEDFRILTTSKKCDDSTESYSRTGISKMLPTVAASMD